MTFALTTIDKLSNNTSAIDWIIENETLCNLENADIQENNRYLNQEGFLCMNSSGDPVSFTLYEKNFGEKAVSDTYDRDFFQWFQGPTYTIVDICRINTYIFGNGDTPRKIFTYSSKMPDVLGFSWGIDASPEGICDRIEPIKLSNTTGTSTLALIVTDNSLSSMSISDVNYPVTNYSVYILHPSSVGLEVNTENPDVIRSLNYENPLGFYPSTYQTFAIRITSCSNFDMNNDGITDVPMPGIRLNEDMKSMLSESKIVGSGFFTAHGDGSGERTRNPIEIPFPQKFIFRSSANDDTISDVVIIISGGQIGVPFSEPDEWVEELSLMERRWADDTTRAFFIVGIIMLILSAILIVRVFSMRDASLSFHPKEKKQIMIFTVLAGVCIAVLYFLLGGITELAGQTTGLQVGETPQMRIIQNFIRTTGYASFVLLTVIPITLGMFVYLSPVSADWVVGLNQILMAKKAGLKAVLKKQELVEKEVEQTEDLRYKIILSPPLGKRPSMTVQRGRILSILTLCMSIGLLCFQYLANYLFPIDDITTISSIISVFFWLFPTIWLLDDAGVLYYINTIKERELEDVESVGGWFGSYLEGFFGISAIITYVQFVINSPILLSYENLGTDSTIILAFVFGFIVLAGLAFGFLVIAVYELSLPFTVGKLYDRLKLRHVDTIQKTIKFENGSELTADFASQAYSKEVNVEVIAETPKLEENKD